MCKFFGIDGGTEVEKRRKDPLLMQNDLINTAKVTWEYLGIDRMVTTARAKVQYDYDFEKDNQHYEVGVSSKPCTVCVLPNRLRSVQCSSTPSVTGSGWRRTGLNTFPSARKSTVEDVFTSDSDCAKLNVPNIQGYGFGSYPQGCLSVYENHQTHRWWANSPLQ